MNDSAEIKQVLVLANKDVAEAMRVAAGLTIFGHQVDLIFVDQVVEETEANMELAEMLDLCEIEPASLVDDPNLDKLSANEFQRRVSVADFIINL